MKTRDWDHLPEYLIEGALLGIFMISASCFGVLLEHPTSPIRASLPDPFFRRVLMGLAMGATALAMIHSPWGKRSGAHFNPAVTFTFFRLGKIAPRDALAYVVAQFAGGAIGMWVASVMLGALVADPAVHFVATVPGALGALVALVAEVVIAALLMSVVLTVSNTPRLADFTGLCASTCVATFIAFEAPISGMSMNPARTLASALVAQDWRALWIYFVAPPAGMWLAAALYTWRQGRARVGCAKLHHTSPQRCIFCEFHRGRSDSSGVGGRISSDPAS